MRNRGVRDALIVTSDGLPGIEDAIGAVYPEAEYQGCVVHVIRNSLKYVSYQDKKEFSRDIKPIYLKKNGVLFCLDATPETIWQRVSHESHRPLLQVEDPIGRIREMLETRKPFYDKADYRIDTSQLTIEQVAEKIVELFRREASDE